MTNEKQPPNYRYIGHTDAPFDFFRGEEKITEEEWRREAPADEVAALDAEPRNAAKAKSSNYESLALEVEKLGHTAERIDATTAAIIEETPSLVTNESSRQTIGMSDTPTPRSISSAVRKRSPKRSGGARRRPTRWLRLMPSPATRLRWNSFKLRAAAVGCQESLVTLSDTSMRHPRRIDETPSLVTKEKQPPHYWYVGGYTDAPFDFFRGEEKITENIWWRQAPADEVAAPDRPRNAA